MEAHVRGVRLSQLPFQERPLNEYETQELKNLIKLRMRGLPLQYLTGTQDFYGREFYVNTSVLVPRPETERLVELALEQLPPAEAGQRLRGLEFGAGSGAIGLTLALERQDVWMTASECSAEALEVARENAARMRVARIDFLHVSSEPQLWQYDELPEQDFLISNPPYLVNADEIAADVRENEPGMALFAPDEDPLAFYRFLAELLMAKVKPEGFGLFEIAEQRGRETSAVFEAAGFTTSTLKDLADRDRYILARKLKTENGSPR